MHTPGLPATVEMERTGSGDVCMTYTQTVWGRIPEVFTPSQMMAICKMGVSLAMPGAVFVLVEEVKGPGLGHPKTMGAS